MRGRGSSIAGNPVLIGAATVLVVLVAVFLSYNANAGLGQTIAIVDAYYGHDGHSLCPMATGISHHVSPGGAIEPCPIIQFATERRNAPARRRKARGNARTMARHWGRMGARVSWICA